MDTNYLHVEAWARAFERVEHRVPRWRIHRQIGKGSDKLVPEFVAEREAAAEADRLHGELYADMQEHAVPVRGARELIASLADRGYEVWFVTSAKPEELEHHMELLEAEGRVSGVVNSSDVEQSKPAPDIFELALRRAGAGAEETVSVGDSALSASSPAEPSAKRT
jgi:beta-phosphoglucomutase-like phosphatase (HAD superfamily)